MNYPTEQEVRLYFSDILQRQPYSHEEVLQVVDHLRRLYGVEETGVVKVDDGNVAQQVRASES